jgi:predicted nuclease with TOPRIM domain
MYMPKSRKNVLARSASKKKNPLRWVSITTFNQLKTYLDSNKVVLQDLKHKMSYLLFEEISNLESKIREKEELLDLFNEDDMSVGKVEKELKDLRKKHTEFENVLKKMPSIDSERTLLEQVKKFAV